MAGVDDGGYASARWERGHHDAIHFLVGDVADLVEVNGIDDLIEAVVLVVIKDLAAVS